MKGSTHASQNLFLVLMVKIAAYRCKNHGFLDEPLVSCVTSEFIFQTFHEVWRRAREYCKLRHFSTAKKTLEKGASNSSDTAHSRNLTPLSDSVESLPQILGAALTSFAIWTGRSKSVFDYFEQLPQGRLETIENVFTYIEKHQGPCGDSRTSDTRFRMQEGSGQNAEQVASILNTFWMNPLYRVSPQSLYSRRFTRFGVGLGNTVNCDTLAPQRKH